MLRTFFGKYLYLQTFSLTRDWFKCCAWSNMPFPRWYSLILKHCLQCDESLSLRVDFSWRVFKDKFVCERNNLIVIEVAVESQHLFSMSSFCSAHSNKEKRERENKCIHLAYKWVDLYIPRHHLLSDVHSFLKASLFENHSLLGTNNVHGKISENNFAPNRG